MGQTDCQHPMHDDDCECGHPPVEMPPRRCPRLASVDHVSRDLWECAGEPGHGGPHTATLAGLTLRWTDADYIAETVSVRVTPRTADA